MTGPELAAARHRLGRSQRELADWLGYTRRSVVGWEAGSQPVPKIVELVIANALAAQEQRERERAATT